MKIFMTGGTGFVGTMLTRRFAEAGHQLTILTRPSERVDMMPASTYLVGDPTIQGRWQEKAADCDVIINLAGASIFSRWNEKYKQILRDSRISTTRHLVEAMALSKGRIPTLLSTSAVGYYGFHGDETLTERDPAGSDFLATLADDWEKEALSAQKSGARVVICRFGIVLGRDGGALGQMIPVFRAWMGADLGSGSQWFSWIHEDDLARIFLFLLESEDLDGPVNCTAPFPVRNRELTEAMGKALHVPTFMPAVPAFMMKLILGEFGDVLLKGQRVIPEKLAEAGFAFQYPQIKMALEDIIR